MNALQRRRPTGGVAVLLLSALLAGCGPFLPPPTAGPSASAGTTQPAPTFVGTPSERLTRALTGLRGGYTFETTLTVAGKDAAHVTGRWFGNNSELSITSGGETVTYRILPPTAWIEDATGAWAEADASSAPSDPLTVLLAPTDVSAGAGAAGVDILIATYPATAFGLPGPDAVSVTISIAPDGSIGARYEATTDAGLGTSETTLVPSPSQDPILAPSPLPAASG